MKWVDYIKIKMLKKFIPTLIMTDNSRKRVNGTECILCMKCMSNCPAKALKL